MDTNLFICFCAYYKKEVEKWQEKNDSQDLSFHFFPAECGRKTINLSSIFDNSISANAHIEIIGCNCLNNLEKGGFLNIHMNKLSQCFSCVAPSKMVDILIRKGNYLLTPGWLSDWKNHIENWNFDPKTAREFFKESSSALALFDTGVETNFQTELQKFAEFVDRPFSSIPIGFDFFNLFVSQIVLKHRLKIETNKKSQALKQSADNAMAMDLLSQIAQTMQEEKVISNILDLFMMLFAPEQCFYAKMDNDKIENIVTPFPMDVQKESFQTNFDGKYAWTEDKKGFMIRISMQDTVLGILRLEKIAFPEYIKKYLTLALNISEICGLAIQNARAFQLINHQKEQLETTLKELKLTQKKLVESEKMASLGALVTGIAHEINTPIGIAITAISSINDNTLKFVDLYKKNKMTKGDIESYLQDAYDSAKLTQSNLDRIANLIKSFKRISVDQLSEEKQIFSIETNILDTITMLKSKWKDQMAIDFSVQCKDNLQINSYEGAFFQIFSNLVLNSIKHGFKNQSNGKVSILIEKIDNAIIIKYHDNGVGIEQEFLPKIF
ncbi:multi-sensor signal transduction histidine kinase, partial [Candidatus Magnetomorum sp. HK-1]